MKVVFLIRSLNRGGAERQVSLLAREMRHRGHQVQVAVFYPGAMDQEMAEAGIEIKRLDKHSRWDIIGFLTRASDYLRQERPDVVYSFLTVGNLVAALLKLRQPSLRVVWGVRASALDMDVYDLAIRLSVKLERLLSFVPNGVVSNSAAGLADLAPPKGQQSAVVPNGVDLEFFQDDPQARAALRQAWGVADQDRLIGLVARVDPMKDHETFLAAAAEMRCQRSDLRFVCVGDATPFDHERLNKLAVKYDIGDLIYSPARSDVAAVYSALDLLVLSSAFGEGSPNVIIEAAACGTPAIVTDVGASAELVGAPDRVVPPRQPKMLAEVCLRLMGQSDFGTTAMKQALRSRVADLYSLNHLAEATQSALVRMIGSANPSCRSLRHPRSVLLVVGSLKFGGAERHLLTIAPALKARGWQPAVYVLSGRVAMAPQMVEAGVPVLGGLSNSPWFSSLPRALRGLLIILDLIRVMLVIRPSISHCFLPQSCIIGGLAGTLAGLRRMVMSRRSLNNYQAAAPTQAKLERLMMRFAAKAVLGNSQAIIDQLQDEGIPAHKLGLIYSGLDPVIPGLDRETLRQVEQIPDDALVMSIVANLHDYKGHAHLLDALALIKEQLPDGWLLLCIGGDAGCLERLIEQRGRLGLSANIRFLGSRPDASRLWDLADIGLLVSLEEGFPMSLLEGMAAGLPMVVTDVGGSPEALGDCGRIVPPADPKALAEAILAYAQDPDLRRRDGKRARARIEGRFTLKACVDGYENLYLGLLDGKIRTVQELIG